MPDNTFTVACTCGAKYRVPAGARGKHVRCKRCPQTIHIPAATDDSELIPLADLAALSKGERLQTAVPTGVHAIGGATTPPGAAAFAAVAPPTLGYATASPGSRRSVVGALARLIRCPSNWRGALTLCGAAVVLIVAYIGGGTLAATGSIRCLLLALITYLVFEGSFAAFSISVVQQAAEGELALPAYPLNLSYEDWWQSLAMPLFAFIGTGLIAIGPAIAYHLCTGTLTVGGPTLDVRVILYLVLLLGGLFLWPMIVLVVALCGFGALRHVARMFDTLVRTFPAYLCLVLLAYGSAAVVAALLGWLALGQTGGVALVAIACAARAYAQTLAMRAIGVYYHLYQDRFDWL